MTVTSDLSPDLFCPSPIGGGDDDDTGSPFEKASSDTLPGQV